MTFVRGQLIADRFRLVNRIGQGALGELWRAVDRVPERQVAIRCVAPFGKTETRRMLMELDAARGLHDRCVARVHRVGVLDDGAVFIASELLVSESLDDLLERRGRLMPGAALALISDIARAIAAAHQRRIAHRAISPRTILLHRDPQGVVTPKLCDFGRAAVLEPLAAYASPEQLTGDAGPGFETDVWALGALLFRCVTGAVPFASLSDAFDAERIVREAEVPEVVRDVLRATLDPVRSQRVAASELATAAVFSAARVPGGFRDLEKMVRIHASVWLDPEATGTIDHFPTIPALGGEPPPRGSEPPIEPARANDEQQEQVEVVTPPEEPKPEPSAPATQETPAHPTPLSDDVFVDFRPPKRRYVIYGAGAAVVAVIALVSIASVNHRPKHRRAVVVAEVPAQRSEPIAPAAPPIVEPKRAVLTTPPPEPEPPRVEPTTVRPVSSPVKAATKKTHKSPKRDSDNPYE